MNEGATNLAALSSMGPNHSTHTHDEPQAGSRFGGSMSARLVFLSLLVVATAGCSQGMTRSMAPAAPRVLQVAPADGATEVRLDAGVTLDFGVAVDRAVVENGFRLLSEVDMTGSCPDSSMAAHGSMDAVMNEPVTLAHMDATHATPGTISWNGAGTECTFMPDSLMRPQTRYMLHMGSAMMEMMNRMGAAMGGGAMNGSGDMMLHFRTMSDDGHGGHH